MIVIRLHKVLIGFLLLFSSSVLADACDWMIPYGQPIVLVEHSTKLCRSAYMVIHDDTHKIPIITIQKFTKDNFSKDVGRHNKFIPDPDLPSLDKSTLSDYSSVRKIFDRGHLVPFEDINYTKQAAQESFYLSNIAPQYSKLNRGLWKSIESKVRKYAEKSVSKDQEVFVITGTIVQSNQTIGKGNVAVPDYFYKIIINKTNSEITGFLVKNEITKSLGWRKYQVPVELISSMTGISYTPEFTNSGHKFSLLKL